MLQYKGSVRKNRKVDMQYVAEWYRLNTDLREVVTLVTERLRTLACELDCGVIAVASQNRMGYTRSENTGVILPVRMRNAAMLDER